MLVVFVAGFSAAHAANVTLAWSASAAPNVVGYRLHYGTASRSYSKHILIGANATSVTVPNLQEGVTYYFAVTATNRSRLESAYSEEVAYTVPLPIVSVVAGTNASESGGMGSFLFTRAGNATKPLTVYFTLDGDAQVNVDYKNPGNRVVFPAGRTNATLSIKPIADRIFEGAKTIELALTESTNIDVSDLRSASILVGDDDQPRISIRGAMNLATAGLQTTVHADAYAGLSVLLQSSEDMTNWNVVAAASLGQAVDYVNDNSADVRTRFYRTIYVRGEVTEESVAEAVAYQLYSANIVGTVSVALRPGWNLVANPLNGVATNGPLGNLPEGTAFVPYGGNAANNYAAGRWTRGIPLTRSTMGGWLYNPLSEPMIVSYVGEVPSTAGKPTIPAGWSVRSSVVSATVNNDVLLGYPLIAGDALFEFNPRGMGASMWLAHYRGPNGWDSAPTLTAGQGVMIYKARATRTTTAAAPAVPVPNLTRFTPLATN